MTREDRCSYRVEAGSGERARGAGAAAPQATDLPGAGDSRSDSRGRSCSRSGKGRLAPPIPVMSKTVGSETFLAVCGHAELQNLGAPVDRTTNTARRPLCPNLQQ
jgi:hypothetical protein